MRCLTDVQRSRLNDLCRAYHVRRLDLFGSAARAEVESAHDLDFFVEFEDLGPAGSFKRYMGLKLDLEELFECPVDLIEPEAVTNPHFMHVASRDLVTLYAA